MFQQNFPGFARTIRKQQLKLESGLIGCDMSHYTCDIIMNLPTRNQGAPQCVQMETVVPTFFSRQIARVLYPPITTIFLA